VPAGELIATFLTAQAAFTERVHAIADDQWQAGTPDACSTHPSRSVPARRSLTSLSR
jgi:hypothetical protein